MGLILDLAIVLVVAVVIGSLAALAWTLAVGASAATARGRAQVAAGRTRVSDLAARMRRDTEADGGPTAE